MGEQLTLRTRAGTRLGSRARTMLFTSDGLEMMSHPLVAERRAARLAGDLPAVDLTCGLGGDLWSLAAVARSALGLDRNEAVAVLAAANVPQAGIMVADAARPPLAINKAAALLDPSRRTGSGRTFEPAAFSPSWDDCLGIARTARRAAIKGPPGIPRQAIPGDSEAEFVQLGRGMREAALWFGEGARPGLRRAVLLPQNETLESTGPECPPEPVTPGALIIDPESCVTRAGLVRHLGARIGARLVDPDVAYLTADEVRPSPLAAVFEVLDCVEFGVSRLRTALRSRGWRAEEIRRRAFPVEPDELRRLLGPMEGEPVTLLFTTIARKRIVFLCRRVPGNAKCETV